MTVTTTTVQKAYTGNGSTFEFAIDFQFWETDEIEVYLRTITTGVEALQLEGTNYTVTGGQGTTGTVDFTIGTVAPPSTVEVHIRRNTVRDQQKDLTPLTKFPSAAAEEALDRAAMAAQEENADRTQRFLKIPVTDIPVDPATAPDMTLPNTVTRSVSGAGGGVLGFNAEGEPIVTTAGLDTALTTAFTLTLLDDADADEALATLGAVKNAGDMDKLDAGTLGARPAASTFGEGLYYSTDDQSLWYSNATAWAEVTIPQFSQSTLPSPEATQAGKVVLDTSNLIFKRDDTVALYDIRAPLPRGAIGGLGLTISGTTDISIAVGEARVGTSSDRSIMNAYNTAAIVKELDTAGGWVAATTNAGRAAADTLGANKWHHVFMLVKPDGTVDFGFDDQLEATALLAEASGYTRYR
ncbi:MAG TPA: hypothetical protein VNA25_25250, partial [Phycisphaerae bacterium]|nr:hypothetical protein [Phycisphaerae bacterium]